MSNKDGKLARGAPPRMQTNNIGAEYDADEVEFLRAVEHWQAQTGRRYPTLTEVLAVAVSLGWRRVAEPGPLPSPAKISLTMRIAKSADDVDGLPLRRCAVRG